MANGFYSSRSVFLALLIAGVSAPAAVGQTYPDCPPPAADEYLLLIDGSDEATRDRTRSLLPAEQPVLVCDYLDETVVRAGGFDSLELANSWALYLNDIELLDAVVVQPVAPATAEVETTASTLPSYDPEVLGPGFAVLVDYKQDPTVGRSLMAQNEAVGLAVYRQDPYLLLLHTENASAAAEKLQQLVADELVAFLVDAQQVVRLTESIQ